SELRADIIYQLGALEGVARSVGATLRHIKPHGALYNTVAHDRRHGDAVIGAILDAAPSLTILGPAGSSFLRHARDAGLNVRTEAFADRAYTPAGSLVPRSEPGAVLHRPKEIAERMVRLVETGTIESI